MKKKEAYRIHLNKPSLFSKGAYGPIGPNKQSTITNQYDGESESVLPFVAFFQVWR